MGYGQKSLKLLPDTRQRRDFHAEKDASAGLKVTPPVAPPEIGHELSVLPQSVNACSRLKDDFHATTKQSITSALSGGQHTPPSGLLLLHVRDEQPVGKFELNESAVIVAHYTYPALPFRAWPHLFYLVLQGFAPGQRHQ
jgi:hypothetical protein